MTSLLTSVLGPSFNREWCTPWRLNQHRVRRFVFAVYLAAIVAFAGSSTEAQTAEFTQGNKGANAVSTQVTLGNYPGRGLSLPVTLNYSSSGLWRIGFISSVYANVSGYQIRRSVTEAIYAEHSTAGWTTSLDVPKVEWPKQNDIYWYTGRPYAVSTAYPYTFRVARVFIHMPGGSTQELRKADAVYQDTGSIDMTGTFYAVDDSRMRYESTGVSTGTLYMGNGTRYVLNGSTTQVIDRNGNTLNYNGSTRQWTDTIGRVIGMPWPANPQAIDYPYSVPAYGESSSYNSQAMITYTLKFKYLSAVFLPDTTGQVIKPISDYYLPNPGSPPTQQGGSNFPQSTGVSTMFVSDYSDPDFSEQSYTYVVGRGQAGAGTFNPIVLAEIDLPNGQSYKFSYNAYGELDKVVYPTGGYERYQFSTVPTVGSTTVPYIQGTRGMILRWVSAPGTGGANEAQWTYAVGAGNIGVTAPNGLRSETSLYNIPVAQANNFGYADARNGMAYEERVYAPGQNGPLLRRSLTDYAQTSSTINKPVPPGTINPGTYTAYRNARPIKSVGLILDTGGDALVSGSTFAYDTTYQFSFGVDRTESFDYPFTTTTQNMAQTAAVGDIALGTAIRKTETAFLNDANYRNRNILGLPSLTQVKAWPANTVVAQTQFAYDEASYPLLTYGSVTGWTNPQDTHRGNITTVGHWLDYPTSTWIWTHAQYDQCGNARYAWDALGRQSQVDYSLTYAYAYATQTTSAVPDNTGTYGQPTSLIATTIYDFNTGLVMSATDANDKVTRYNYNDSLNRVKTVIRPDGGVTTYNYGDTLGSLYVETLTQQDATRNIDAFQFFDQNGRPSRSFLTVASGTYITSDTEYDLMGRAYRASNPYLSSGAASAINPSGYWTTTGFDTLSRVISVTTPDGAQATTGYGFSASGTLGATVTATDQAARKRRSLTDAFGRLVRVDEPDANGNLDSGGNPVQATKYTYDLLNNLRKVEQGVQLRYFGYDSLSRLIRVRNVEQTINASLGWTDPVTNYSGGWTMSLSYYDNSTLYQRKDARGVLTTYAYDALNRTTTITYSGEPQGQTPTPNVSRYYDGYRSGTFNSSITNSKGRPWQVETAGATGSRTTIDGYDMMGRPAQQEQQFKITSGWSASYKVGREYDFGGHVKSQTYPSGHTVTYNYDQAGRLGDKVPQTQSLSEMAFTGNLGDGVQRSYSSAISYSPLGGMQEERYGTLTPLYHKQHYNIRGQLYDNRLSNVPWATDQWNWNRGALLNWYDSTSGFTRQNPNSGTDNSGNVVRTETWIPNNDQMSTYNWMQQNYSYDSLNRLTSVTELQNGVTPAYGQAYTYDLWGNRTIDANPAKTFGPLINAQQLVVDPNNTNRLYAPNDASHTVIDYDAAGNQTKDYLSWNGQRTYDAENHMLTATNSATNTYTYDAGGRRVRRNIAGVEVWQVYGMDGELVAEYAANAATFVPHEEYGYRGGQLLITAANGDEARLTNFIYNFYFRFGVSFTSNDIQTRVNAIAAAGNQGGSAQLFTEARNQAQAIVALSNIPSDTNYVTAIYLTYCQRFPDSGGLNYWVSQIPYVGRNGVRDAFAAPGGEFSARVSNLWGTSASDAERTDAFVQYMYNAILHRWASGSEDTSAIGTFDNAGATGQANVVTTAGNWARGLFNSSEYTTRPGLTPHDFVYDLYQAFLRYAPDQAGWDWWTTQVGANWQNKQAVMDAFINAGPYAQQAGTLYREVLWLTPDHLGTPRMIAERTGALVGIKRHDYLPFGEELTAQGGRTPQLGYAGDSVRQHFTGYEADGESGLNYAQARYQSTIQGRFTSVDPLGASANTGNPQSFNRYSYVNNNPMNATDPSGMALSDIGVYQTEDAEDAKIGEHQSLRDLQRTVNADYRERHPQRPPRPLYGFKFDWKAVRTQWPSPFEGQSPMIPFATKREAATMAIQIFNPQSIAQDLEYSGWVCKAAAGGFVFSVGPASLRTRGHADRGLCPPWTLGPTDTDWHTHAAWSKEFVRDGVDFNETFSPPDKRINNLLKGDGYLGTPHGKILRFIPGLPGTPSTDGEIEELPERTRVP